MESVSYQLRVFHNSEASECVPVAYDRRRVVTQGVTDVSKENTASIFSFGRLPISPHDGVVTQKPVTYQILFVRVYERMYVMYVYKYLRILLRCDK
jgi:hypothetical protein